MKELKKVKLKNLNNFIFQKIRIKTEKALKQTKHFSKRSAEQQINLLSPILLIIKFFNYPNFKWKIHIIIIF